MQTLQVKSIIEEVPLVTYSQLELQLLVGCHKSKSVEMASRFVYKIGIHPGENCFV